MTLRITIQNKKQRLSSDLKHRFNCLFFILTALLTLISSPAALAKKQHTSAEELKPIVLRALENKAESLSQTIKSSRYDVRIDALPLPAQLNRCENKPAVTFLTGAEAGTQRIKIECTIPQRWSIYARGNISLHVPVLVSRRTLARGENITPDDVVPREHDISELRRGYLLSDYSLNNQQLARRVSAGDIITPQTLQKARLIRRGDRITIVAGNSADNGGFTISMSGEALEDGKLNQSIRVRNLSSGKVIRGTVSGNTEVQVL